MRLSACTLRLLAEAGDPSAIKALEWWRFGYRARTRCGAVWIYKQTCWNR